MDLSLQPMRSFYQSKDYVACLVAAGVAHHTLDTESGLVVAAAMQDGGFEIWEGPQRKADVISAWRWLLGHAQAAGARYARMVLPIGNTWSLESPGSLPAPTSADTLLIATQPPQETAFLSGYLRLARQAQRHRVQIVETTFAAARFADTYLALARDRGFFGEVDVLEVLIEASARRRITVLEARSDHSELLGYLVLLEHEGRLETRYPWRLPKAGSGTMNRLIVGAWEYAKGRGIPFLDLGGIPTEAATELKGIGAFKASSGGLRYERSAFLAELSQL